MALYGGIEIPGVPSLENVRKLDLLQVPILRKMSRFGMEIDVEFAHYLESQMTGEMKELEYKITSYIPSHALHLFVDQAAAVEANEEEKAIQRQQRQIDGETVVDQVSGDASINIASAEQICTLVYDVLQVGAGMELKKTKGGDRLSTGKKQLELLKSKHAVVQLILDYRERAKLVTTYCRALPRKAKFHPRSVGNNTCQICEMHHTSESWRCHTEFATTRATTGRVCSRNPNLANIPARSELGALVRAMFVAGPENVLVSRDFGQIELCDLAHLARAESMINVYQQKKDIHIYTACEAFGVDYDWIVGLLKKKKNKLTTAVEDQQIDFFKQFQRMPSKNLNFMIVYGATVMGLLAQLALSGLIWTEEEGNAFIDKWFNLYPEVREFMERMYYRAARYGFVWDEFGRIRLTPECASFHSWIRSAGLRQAGNMPIQSLSAGQLKICSAKVDDRLTDLREAGVWNWPLVSIYDQLIVETSAENAQLVDETMDEAFKDVMVDVDTQEYRFRVPISSDGEIVSRWCKD